MYSVLLNTVTYCSFMNGGRLASKFVTSKIMLSALLLLLAF